MSVNRVPRFACTRCGELLAVDAKFCGNCGAAVADMKLGVRSNLRGAYLAGKEIWKEGAPEREAAKARSKELKASQARAKALDRKPVKAVVVASQTKTGKSVLSAAGRGLVGGLIAGPVGAVIGGATASSFVSGQKVTFAVEYASGRKGTETVEVGSLRFKEIAEVLV